MTLVELKLLLELYYGPPNTYVSDFNNDLENVIISLTSTKSSLILVGDYNSNLLNHEIHTETGHFLNVLSSNSIIPLITKPTRYGEHSATLIDNILTNKSFRSDSKYHSGIILEDISDHLPVFFITGEVVFEKTTTL